MSQKRRNLSHLNPRNKKKLDPVELDRESTNSHCLHAQLLLALVSCCPTNSVSIGIAAVEAGVLLEPCSLNTSLAWRTTSQLLFGARCAASTACSAALNAPHTLPPSTPRSQKSRPSSTRSAGSRRRRRRQQDAWCCKFTIVGLAFHDLLRTHSSLDRRHIMNCIKMKA